EEVDIAPGRLVRDRREEEEDSEERDDADGDVHVEDPPPGEVVGEIAADDRSDDRGDAEDAAKDALHAGAGAGIEEVGDRCEDVREEHAAEEPLDAAEGDELG